MGNIMQIASDKNVMQVVRETLYPGATEAEAGMILSYCMARKIDPLLKPVHLVPMRVKSGKKDGSGKDMYEFRNVVMPGIALYRIDAARTGQYAGMSEPEFGPTMDKYGVSFPEWCKVTVKKLLGDNIVEFTAKEYWLENYATAGKDNDAPNAMWKKRAFGQIAKCAEAQALRKAFPEAVPHEYTKEEMEGKFFHPEKESKPARNSVVIEHEAAPAASLKIAFEGLVQEMSEAKNVKSLQDVFMKVKGVNWDGSDYLSLLIDAKDAKKNDLTTQQFMEEFDEVDGVAK